jgi:hypothetical protein
MNREQRLDNVRPEWEPIPWDVAEPEAEAQRAGYDRRATWPIVWSAIPWQGWPEQGLFGESRDWFGRNEVEHHARHEGEDLILVKRAWAGWPDPPQYGLASRAGVDALWAYWGSFDFPPEAWRFPEETD